MATLDITRLIGLLPLIVSPSPAPFNVISTALQPGNSCHFDCKSFHAIAYSTTLQIIFATLDISYPLINQSLTNIRPFYGTARALNLFHQRQVSHF